MRRSQAAAVLALAAQTVGVADESLRHSILRWSLVLNTFDALIVETTGVLEKLVLGHRYGSILLSFPGVGTVVAATLIGGIGEIGRFPTKRQFRKYCGFYGEEEQSGGAAVRMKRGKGGNRALKRVLTQAVAQSLSPKAKQPNDIADYYHAQLAKGKVPMQGMYRAAAKLADLIYFCLTRNQPYIYQGRYGPTPMSGRGRSSPGIPEGSGGGGADA